MPLPDAAAQTPRRRRFVRVRTGWTLHVPAAQAASQAASLAASQAAARPESAPKAEPCAFPF